MRNQRVLIVAGPQADGGALCRQAFEARRVNVAFVGSNPERYVSISGRGTVTRDEARIDALWNPAYRAWALLTVYIERVEYWDVPSSRLVRLWGVARALATRQPAEAGEHRAFVLDGDAAD